MMNGRFQGYQVYSTKDLFRGLSTFGLMILVMYLTHGVGFVLFLFFAVLAVMQNKTERMLLLMMVAMCSLVGNGALMPKSGLFSILHKIMMVVMAVALATKLAGHRHSPLVTPLMGISPYLLFMALSSIQGWSPVISYLKLFLFTMTYYAFYSMANTIILDGRVSIERVRSVYLGLCCVIILGSVILIPFPGISQMRSDEYLESLKAGKQLTSLFCGMTFHSQALGPTVAILFTLLLADMLFTARKADRLMLLLLICCPILIYKTSSRTAMGSVLAGGFFIMYLFMKARRVGNRWRGKVLSAFLLISILGAIALLVSSSGRQGLSRYVLKDQNADSLKYATKEDVVSSRQGLMDDAMDNFRKKPLLGNGFQVSENQIDIDTDNVKNILSAPVEKGVWVTAVLEEGGAIGMSLFVMFGLVAMTKLVKRGAYVCASVLFTIFIVNLGEFTMFSMSGIGGFCWCLCFVGAVMDANRLKCVQR